MGADASLMAAEAVEIAVATPKRLLVVGAPRSGTLFFANFLQTLGMRVNHERMGQDGVVNASWLPMRAEGDNFIGSQGRQDYTFERILHLVRHPLPCIESMSRELPKVWWDWQEQYSELAISDPKDLERVAALWIFWTDGCQHLCDAHIRLEDVAHLGERVNKGRNDPSQITLDDLGSCAGTVELRMGTYGYRA